MDALNLLILALFTWYVAYVLIKTSGPFHLFARLRALTTIGGLLECLYCLVIWIAVLGYLLINSPFALIAHIGAIAGGAMMMHRWTGGDYS